MNSSYNISMNMNVDNIGLQNNFSARSWPLEANQFALP